MKLVYVNQKAAIKSSHTWVLLNATLSSGAICLYAVSVALKQGTLSTAAILSEARIKSADAVKKGFRGHLSPSVATLLATAAVFLVSVAITSAGALDGTLLDSLFSLPARFSQAVLPSGQASAYALFHMANFVFVYCLAALGLKVREEVRAARTASA